MHGEDIQLLYDYNCWANARILHAPGDVRCEERPEPTILEPTDAIVWHRRTRCTSSTTCPGIASEMTSRALASTCVRANCSHSRCWFRSAAANLK